MKRILIILVLFGSLGTTQAQFPNTDSLQRYINKWIRNNAIDAFTNLRLNTALNGLLTELKGVEVSNSGIDQMIVVGDSLKIITTANDTFSVKLPSGGSGATNLSVSRTATQVNVLSSTGTTGILPPASQFFAGIMTAADKAQLDSTVSLALLRDSVNNRLRDLYRRGDSVFYVTSGAEVFAFLADASVGSGTVTSVGSGYGLSGGPITASGTLAVDTATLSGKYLRRADSLTGYTSRYRLDTANANIRTLLATKLTNITGLVGIGTGLSITGSGTAGDPYLLSNASSGGTVTSVGSGYGLTGGPITGAGTLVVDSAALAVKFLRRADTALIFTDYRNAINTRVKYGDTASMLLPYYNLINSKGNGTVSSFSFSDGNGFDGTVNNSTTNPTLSLSLQNAAADGATRGQAAFVGSDFNAASGVISLDYVNGQKASSTLSGFLSATDWQTFNGKISNITGLITPGTNVTITGSGTSGSPYVINATPGGGGSGTVNFGAANTLAYYSAAGTVIDDLAAITPNRALISNVNGLPVAATTTATEIGYLNGVTSGIQGQLNGKQNTITTGTNLQYLRGDLSLATFPTNLSSFSNGPGYITNATGLVTAGSNITVTGAGTAASPYVINGSAGTTYTAGTRLTLVGNQFNVDSAGLLAPYQTALNARVRYTDTATMLAPYAAKINTKLENITGKIIAGTNVTITGAGTTASPYEINASPGGGGSGTVNTGLANRLAYYTANGTVVDDLAAITANRLVVSDANGLPTHSTATATEAGYLAGVTSGIQTQLNGKEATLPVGTSAQYFRGDKTLGTFPTDLSSFANGPGYLTNITGKVTAGANISITGAGTTASPYVIAGTGGGIATNGLPTGGSPGWMLYKSSSADYAATWGPAPSFSVGSGYGISVDGENNIRIDSAALSLNYIRRGNLVAGSNVTITPQGNQYVIAASGGSADTVSLSNRINLKAGRIRLSEMGIVSDANLDIGSSTFGTDQTAAIQAILNTATTANPLYIIWDVKVSVTGLAIKSDTYIQATGNNGAILRDNANNFLFRTAGWTRPFVNIENQNITIDGGIWNGNGFRGGVERQTRVRAVEGMTTGFSFVNVRNLVLKNFKLVNTRAFGILGANMENVVIDNFTLDQTADPQINQDGIDLLGHLTNIHIRNGRMRCGDERLIFVANPPQTTYGFTTPYNGADGDQDGIYVENIEFWGPGKGFRFNSTANKMENVFVRNIHGIAETYYLLVENGDNLAPSFPLVPGPGFFKNMHFENISVEVPVDYPTDNKPDFTGAIMLSGGINGIHFKNVTRNDLSMKRSTFAIGNPYSQSYNIKNLTIDGYESNDVVSTTSIDHIYVYQGTVESMTLSNFKILHAADNGSRVLLNRDTIFNLIFHKIEAHNVKQILQDSASVGWVSATNIRHTGHAADQSFNTRTTIPAIAVSNYLSSVPAVVGGTTPITRGDAFSSGGGGTSPWTAITGGAELTSSFAGSWNGIVRNSSTATNAIASLRVVNDANQIGLIGKLGSNYSGSGLLPASTTYLYSDAAMSILAGGNINFSNNGTTLSFQIPSTGLNDGTGVAKMLTVTNGVAALATITGGSGTPAGASTQLQFNNSGAFGASANLTYDGTSLIVKGSTSGFRFREYTGDASYYAIYPSGITAAAGNYLLSASNDGQFAYLNANSVGLVGGGAIQLLATSAGVTINNSTNAYKLPTVRGTAGYVLTTDGVGGTSWAAAGGGGSQWTSITGGIEYVNSFAGAHNAIVRNSSTANNAVTTIRAVNDANDFILIGKLSNAYTTSGLLTANTGYLLSSKLLISSNANPIEFSTNSGSTRAMTIPSAGLNDGTGVAKMVTVNNGVLGYAAIPGGGGGSGTVTGGSGGTTGLTLTGSTTLTLGGTLAVAHGGTGTSTPALVAGSGISITGTWPNNTISATNSDGSIGMTFTGSVTGATTTSYTGSLQVDNGEAGIMELYFVAKTSSGEAVTRKLRIAYNAISASTIQFFDAEDAYAQKTTDPALSGVTFGYGSNGSGDLVLTITGVAGFSIETKCYVRKYPVGFSS